MERYPEGSAWDECPKHTGGGYGRLLSAEKKFQLRERRLEQVALKVGLNLSECVRSSILLFLSDTCRLNVLTGVHIRMRSGLHSIHRVCVYSHAQEYAQSPCIEATLTYSSFCGAAFASGGGRDATRMITRRFLVPGTLPFRVT